MNFNDAILILCFFHLHNNLSKENKYIFIYPLSFTYLFETYYFKAINTINIERVIWWSIAAREDSHLAFLIWLLFRLIFSPKIYLETSSIIPSISKRSIPTELIKFLYRIFLIQASELPYNNYIRFLLLETSFLTNSPISNVVIDEIHLDVHFYSRNVSVTNHY